MALQPVLKKAEEYQEKLRGAEASIRAKDVDLGACHVKRDLAQAELVRATSERDACRSEVQDCRQQLRPAWMKWTALTVAAVSTVWTGREVVSYASARNAYNGAPLNAPDLGARHIDVVEARGRLLAAGAATIVSWAWYLSLKW